MSSKSVEAYGGSCATTPPSSWSITRRLTLFYTLATFTVLATSSGILYWGLVNSLEIQTSSHHRGEVVTEVDVVLNEYRQKLIPVLLVGVLVSAGVGFSIVRRGLSPVRKITETTQRITASHLDERIHSARWPQELGELALSFDSMLDRLQESFDRLNHCASNLAHELRTPINNLMGEAEVLISQTRTPEEYRQAIVSSLEEYRRLTRILDSLLFLGRAESRLMAAVKSDLQVRPEIVKLCDYYEAMAEERGIRMSCGGEAMVQADPSLLRRAVGNLISNALKYTPPGGNVAVLASRKEDMAVEITVSDSGCGIAPRHIPRLYDRFYRIQESGRDNPDGVGLGLAIVKSIMDLHGGSVSVQSQPGSGTTFKLCFPHPSPKA